MAAPVDRVWEEIADLDTILVAAPGLIPDPGGGARSAPVTLQVRWGPLAWAVHGHAALRQLHPPHGLLVVVALPELALEYRGRVELTSTGADRAAVRYQGHLRCAHRYARRWPAFLEAVVEDHVRAVLAIVRRRAEARHQARVRLGAPGAGRSERRAGPPPGLRAMPVAERWA
jgi:hypothetical protein